MATSNIQEIAETIITSLAELTKENPNSVVDREEFRVDLELPPDDFETAVRRLASDHHIIDRPDTLSITVGGGRYAESIRASRSGTGKAMNDAEAVIRVEQELSELDQILAKAKSERDFDAAGSRLDRWTDRVAQFLSGIDAQEAERFSEVSGQAVIDDDWGNLERDIKAKRAFLTAMKEELQRAPSQPASSTSGGQPGGRSDAPDDIIRSLEAAGWGLGPEKILGEGGSGRVLRCYPADALKALEQGGTSPRAGALAVLGKVGDAVSRGEAVAAAVKISTRADVRFKREVDALQKCSHPSLVRLLAFDSDGEPRWFVMELMGPDLEKHAEHFRDQPLEAIRAMRPVVEAAASLHAKSYVHRDIKPKNIFRRGDSWVLGDLGIAHENDQTRLTSDGSFAGSQDWVADWVRPPEREPQPVDDVYQLVKVMHYLTTRKRDRASQLRKQFASIAPDAQTPFDVFFQQHLVTDEEDCKSKNASELLKRVDELLARQVPIVQGGLLASVIAAQDGAWFREDASALVLIPAGARELHARCRHGNGQGVAHFELRSHEQSGLPSLRSTEVRINSSNIAWSLTMKLKLPSAMRGDWFMVTFPRNQVPVSGFLLFYT